MELTPLIFGDVVTKNCPVWNLLLLLIQIVNIVFSPRLTNGMTYYLKHLIHDHHTLFKTLLKSVQTKTYWQNTIL